MSKKKVTLYKYRHNKYVLSVCYLTSIFIISMYCRFLILTGFTGSDYLSIYFTPYRYVT